MSIFDEDSGETTTVPLGDIIAASSDSVGSTVSSAVTGLTGGNGLFGITAGAAVTAFLAGAARKKKAKVMEEA